MLFGNFHACWHDTAIFGYFNSTVRRHSWWRIFGIHRSDAGGCLIKMLCTHLDGRCPRLFLLSKLLTWTHPNFSLVATLAIEISFADEIYLISRISSCRRRICSSMSCIETVCLICNSQSWVDLLNTGIAGWSGSDSTNLMCCGVLAICSIGERSSARLKFWLPNPPRLSLSYRSWFWRLMVSLPCWYSLLKVEINSEETFRWVCNSRFRNLLLIPCETIQHPTYLL